MLTHNNDAGTTQNRSDDSVTMDDLVRDMLGLDPAVLARFGEANDSKDFSADRAQYQGATSRRGLNLLLRRTLALVVRLEDDERAVVRLKTEATARRNGWPDARTANVAMLLVWALVEENREVKGLPSVRLMTATGRQALDPKVAEPPSAADLVQSFCRSLWVQPEWNRRRERLLASPPATAVGTPVASTNQAIKEWLRLDPRTLASVLEPSRQLFDQYYEAAPEATGRMGLGRLLLDAMRQFITMKHRGVEEIRLMTDADARIGLRPDARSANVATLLSAGLLSEEGNEPTFEPARPPTAQHQKLLRTVAKYVYFEGSKQSYQALQLLCDSNVHFGVYKSCRGYDQAARLLNQVELDHDPADERFPHLPSSIEFAVLVGGPPASESDGTD